MGLQKGERDYGVVVGQRVLKPMPVLILVGAVLIDNPRGCIKKNPAGVLVAVVVFEVSVQTEQGIGPPAKTQFRNMRYGPAETIVGGGAVPVQRRPTDEIAEGPDGPADAVVGSHIIGGFSFVTEAVVEQTILPLAVLNEAHIGRGQFTGEELPG